MLSIFLVVARQVEDRWCVLWVEFKSLLVAFECRLEGGFVLILVQDYAFMIPKLWVHVRIELLGRRLALSVSRVSVLHLTLLKVSYRVLLKAQQWFPLKVSHPFPLKLSNLTL